MDTLRKTGTVANTMKLWSNDTVENNYGTVKKVWLCTERYGTIVNCSLL